MNNLCKQCHDWLASIGRDVELYGNKPLMARPCVMCGEPTDAYLVPWDDWMKATYYPITPK